MNIKTFNQKDETDWNDFINKSNKAGIFHTLEWKKILEEEYGFKQFYLLAEDSGEICGVLPLFLVESIITGNRLVSLPFSYYCDPVAINDNVVNLLINSAKKIADNLNCKYLELKMQKPLPENIINNMSLNKNDYFFTSIVKLSNNPKENWKKLDTRRTRWAINKALKSGIKIRPADSIKDLQEFYDLKVKTRRKHGSPAPSFEFYKNIMHEMEPKGMIKLWVAEYNKKIVASLMFFTYKDTVMPAYVASDDKYMSYMPNNLLYWKAIEWGCSNGYNYFDFGRTEPGNVDLLKFKTKWGAENFKIHYYYYPYQPNLITTNRSGLKYNIVTSIWKKVPLSIAKKIGPILQKQVG